MSIVSNLILFDCIFTPWTFFNWGDSCLGRFRSMELCQSPFVRRILTPGYFYPLDMSVYLDMVFVECQRYSSTSHYFVSQQVCRNKQIADDRIRTCRHFSETLLFELNRWATTAIGTPLQLESTYLLQKCVINLQKSLSFFKVKNDTFLKKLLGYKTIFLKIAWI